MTDLLQALLTPVIAIITTYIAYQQYRISRDERAMVLYDRRLAIFRSVVGIVDRVRAGNALTTEEVFSWESSMTETPFLFGKEVEAVIDPLFGALHDYAIKPEPVTKGKPYSSCAEAALAIEAFRWPLTEAFAPYLSLPGSQPRAKRPLSVEHVNKLVSDISPKNDTESQLEGDVPF